MVLGFSDQYVKFRVDGQQKLSKVHKMTVAKKVALEKATFTRGDHRARMEALCGFIRKSNGMKLKDPAVADE